MRITGARYLMAAAVAALAVSAMPMVGAQAAQLSLCGNPGPAPVNISHVIVVMLENASYRQVVGSPNAPYETSLAGQCGVASADFAATHSSAANYLAMSAGEFPASSPPGCGSVSHCADSSDNLYHQLTVAGRTWTAFMEAMPTACDPSSGGAYKIGHNPVLFYQDVPAATCQAADIGVSDLTAQYGAFFDDLQGQSLPALSWVTPDLTNDGEGPWSAAQNEQAADAWLQAFMANIQQSPSYLAGNTLVLVTYDEGTGSDRVNGEDCTNKSLDLPVTGGVSAHQDSCHVALFVVYPYTAAGTVDPTFFDHYSVTKTVEDLFSLPYLAHAGDAQTTSLVGHFGITSGPTATPPTVSIAQPGNNSTVSGTLTLSGTANATGGAGIAQVQVSVDNGAPIAATGTASWTASIDTTALADGVHTITAQATDTGGLTGQASVTVTVSNTVTTTSCPASPPGATELSGNLSLESSQTGWTGVYSTASVNTRVQPAGGSYDGSWALQVALKSGSTGTAGVNNANPIWVPGPPGAATTAGQVFTGSAVVQASTPGETISLLVRETTPTGTGVSYHTTTMTLGDTGWHQITSAYTAKGSGDLIRYSLYASNLANSSQNFQADCLSLHTP